MHDHGALLLMAVAFGAFVMPFISRRFMLPTAVGEIAYGLVLGMVFSWQPADAELVRFLGELGFIVLMYLAGLEINFEKIKESPRLDLWLYVVMFGLVTVLSFGIAWLLGQSPVFGLVYMTTAVGLLFPVLKETGLLQQALGQRLLIMGSIGEVFALIGFTLLAIYVKSGISLDALVHIGQIVLFLLFAYCFHRLLDYLTWWFPGLIGPFLRTGDSSETGVRANLANMFIFVALAAMMGLKLIVGAFLGGMLFGLVFKEREAIMEKIGAFGYGFLVPVFFIEVGLRFDPRLFLDLNVLLMAGLVSVIMLAVRYVASPVLLFSSMRLEEVLLVPSAMAFPLTLLVAISTYALEGKLIPPAQAAALLLAAILTALVYPLMFRLQLAGDDTEMV